MGRRVSPFINYFRSPARTSPVNLAVVRIILGLYLSWRLLSTDWGAIQQWPQPPNQNLAAFHQDMLMAALPYTQWIALVALLSFVIGYKIKWSGLIAAVIVMFMATMQAMIYLAGNVEMLLVTSYFLLFFALFHEDDLLSIDGVIRTTDSSPSELNQFLKSEAAQTHSHRVLK